MSCGLQSCNEAANHRLGMQAPVTQWHCSAPNWGAVTRSERKRRAHVLLSCLNPSRPRKPSELLKQSIEKKQRPLSERGSSTPMTKAQTRKLKPNT